MRIAILTEVFLPKVDGIVNTLCHLLDHLSAGGHTSIVVAPEGAPSTYGNSRVIPAPALAMPLYPEVKLASPWTNVGADLDEFHPDLVHIVNPVSIGLAGLRYARSRGLPLVASYHTDLPGFAARWGLGAFSGGLYAYLRWIHNQADLNLCPSRATQDELARNGFERLCVWTRGVDTERFAPRRASVEMRSRLSGGNPDAPLFIYVGRLSSEKRVDWLKAVLEVLPGTRLAVVGDGPQREELQNIFSGMPVTFTGYLRGAELAEAYASGDIFAFPAANETFGNVALEAMASGLPVIAPAAGGVLDFIETEQNGLLFDPESIDSLIAQAARLVNQPAWSAELGVSARRTAEQRGWAQVLDGLLAQYSALTSRERTLPLTTLRAGRRVSAQRSSVYQ